MFDVKKGKEARMNKEYPKISIQKWPEGKLVEKRKEVLAMWPTGKEIDLEEAVDYHKRIPKNKRFVEVFRNAKAKNEGPLVELAVGHATTQQTLEHIQGIEKEGVDSVFIFTDAYTRKARYKEAQRAIDESIKSGKSLLSGYPIVNFGHKEARQIVENSNIPITLWDGVDELPMLQFEVAIAAGFTGHGSHDLHDLFQHVKDYPLYKRIENNQYGCRLAAWYQEHGASINMFMPANLLGYDPLDIKISLIIITAIATAVQGNKSISPYIGASLNLIQDVAAMKVCRKLFRYYLDKFGYKDVELTFYYGTWQGSWPEDLERARAVVVWNAVIATLGSADVIWMRSLAEGRGTPNVNDNIATLKLTKQTINMLRWQKIPNSPELSIEEEMLERSVRAIVDKVIEMGEGDPLAGQIEAARVGILDASFSGWKHTYGKVMPVRDVDGAIRWYDHGNLPLPKEVIEYHRKKIAERGEKTGKTVDINDVVKDLFWISGDDVITGKMG